MTFTSDPVIKAAESLIKVGRKGGVRSEKGKIKGEKQLSCGLFSVKPFFISDMMPTKGALDVLGHDIVRRKDY